MLSSVLIVSSYGRLLERIRTDKPRGNCRKAGIILSWIACAERTLKVHELLDAIALSSTHELTMRTKLIVQELDRCKPLIEVDRSGRVVFVHFTVKE